MCVRACVSAIRWRGRNRRERARGGGGGGKVEVEEEDLYAVESGGEKGGGITAVPFVPRGGGETEKNEIPRIARQ